MSNLQPIVQNAFSADNSDNSDGSTTAEGFSHWQRICAAGIAAVNAASTAWIQLTAASVVLNSNDVRMSASDKEAMRRNILDHLIQSERSCSELISMSPDTFKLLCEKLKGTGRLRSYSHTSVEEQVATFLFIIGQKFTNRAIAFFMSQSGETCSRYFHNVLRALIALATDLIQQPTRNDLSTVISGSARFYPYFKDCLGALDGTHVRVKVPRHDAARYRGRKDFPTQNVLACCTFNMRFTYVLAGWEGSASDSQVLKSALTRHDALKIPNGKYYLGDAGFGLSNKVLVPYGRTRYHLKEYAARAPQNARELFNLRHASLRNCIERCFGVFKKRFPIISAGSECQYSCATMTGVILGCCVLHNFLLIHDPDHVSSEYAEAPLTNEDEGSSTNNVDSPSPEDLLDYYKGKELRDSIASAMWNQYESEGAIEPNPHC